MRGVRKGYRTQAGGDATVLHDVDFDAAEGEVVMIRGPSGCGKSTLLNILGGLDSVDGGEVVVDGTPLHRRGFPALAGYRARVVGFVFQFHNLIPTLTAEENVLCGLEAIRPVTRDDTRLARDILASVGLAGHEGAFPGRMSGGQQQRVAIARALVKRPRLILADEPTGSLDEETGAAVMALLMRMRAEHGATVLLVTHNPELGIHADRVCEMRSGRLIDAA